VVGGIRVAAYCAPPPPTRRATAAAATRRPHRVVATAFFARAADRSTTFAAFAGSAGAAGFAYAAARAASMRAFSRAGVVALGDEVLPALGPVDGHELFDLLVGEHLVEDLGERTLRGRRLEVCGERPLSLDPRPQRIEDEQGEARLGLGDERGPDRRAG
jgi:hypothetical protein